MEIAIPGEGLGVSLTFPITNANYPLHLHPITSRELVGAQAVECLLFGECGVLVHLKLKGMKSLLQRLNICRHT